MNRAEGCSTGGNNSSPNGGRDGPPAPASRNVRDSFIGANSCKPF
jgi:hypothetical protein